MSVYSKTVVALAGAIAFFSAFVAGAKEHEIIVEGARATIDGIPMTRTVPFLGDFATLIFYAPAVRALGREERSGYGHNDLVLCWDSMGFSMLRDGDIQGPGRILNFAIVFQKEEAGRSMTLKNTFSGSLRLNGVRVTSATRIGDIAPALRKTGFRNIARKGEHPCYAVDQPQFSMSLNADEDGRMYNFIFYSCGREGAERLPVNEEEVAERKRWEERWKMENGKWKNRLVRVPQR